MISHEKARSEITAIYNDNTQVSCEYILEYIAQNEQQSNDFIEKYESLEIKYFQFVQDTKRVIELLETQCYPYEPKTQEVWDELKSLTKKLKGHRL